MRGTSQRLDMDCQRCAEMSKALRSGKRALTYALACADAGQRARLMVDILGQCGRDALGISCL
jgi:hypothetical protein